MPLALIVSVIKVLPSGMLNEVIPSVANVWLRQVENHRIAPWTLIIPIW